MREHDGRCMSSDRKGTDKSICPERLSHQPGSYPGQGWYKGHKQQIHLYSENVWVPS